MTDAWKDALRFFLKSLPANRAGVSGGGLAKELFQILHDEFPSEITEQYPRFFDILSGIPASKQGLFFDIVTLVAGCSFPDQALLLENLENIVRRLPLWGRALCYANLDSFSQEGEDLLLREQFASQATGFFVDVGAHHPYRFSNTAYFYFRGWNGINIDPTPGSMQLFTRERPRDINLEIGIDESEMERDLFVFDEPALNTYDEKRAQSLQKNTRYQLKSVHQTKLRPLRAVLAEHLAAEQPIDFLSIDVEGLELTVLRSNDWGKFRPKIVLLEVLDLDFRDLSGNAAVCFMKEQGYTILFKSMRSAAFKEAADATKN